MLKANKVLSSIAIILFALIIVATSFVLIDNTAYAQNTSIVIDLNETSMFDVYSNNAIGNDVFAYTYGTSVYIAENDEIKSFPNAFAGTCIGLKVNATNILLLAKNGTTYALYYFDYDDYGIKSAQNKLGVLKDSTEIITALFKDDTGKFYFVRNYSLDMNQLVIFSENPTSVNTMDRIPCLVSPSYQIQDYMYYTSSGYVYAIIGGEIYRAEKSAPIIKPDGEDKFVKITSITNATHITYLDGEAFVNTTTGIYKFDVSTLNVKKLADTTNGTGIITTAVLNDAKYVFTCEANAITQYLYDGATCTYFNKFNNSKYVHPTSFDLLYIAKLTAVSANMYSSPRNMQITSTLTQDDYFLVLTKVENADSGTYYYVAQADGTMGYIKQDTSFDKVEPNTNAKTLKIGLYAQGLFPKTNIYKYPYPGSEVLLEIEGYDELVVKSNVAQDGDNQVWNYYEVSYVKDGEIYTGYVKLTDVAPYTRLTAPTVLKTVKISTGAIGSVVYLYALPSEESTQVAALTDGEELDLAEEYNKDSTWTKVVYKDTYAYVLTSQISQKGLTAVQITLIVISSLIVVASVIMIIFMKKKRRIGF